MKIIFDKKSGVFYWVVILLSLVFLVVYWFSIGRIGPDKKNIGASLTSKGGENRALSSTEAVNATVRPLIADPIRSEPKFVAVRPRVSRLSPMQAIRDFENFVNRAASGDGPAAVALLEAINACSPLPAASEDNLVRSVKSNESSNKAPWPECEKVREPLSRSRLLILQPAIDAGSVEAKYAYAISVRQVFLAGDLVDALPNANSLDQVQRLSAKYAAEAGASGMWEGYAYLSKVTGDGQWGLRDAVGSYAYALAAARAPGAPAALTLNAERLRAQLPPNQVLEGEKLAGTFR